MKYSKIIFSIFLLLLSFNNFSYQIFEKEYKHQNEIYNNYVFLFRNIWNDLDKNSISKIKLDFISYKKDINFHKSFKSKDYYFNKVFNYIMENDEIPKKVILYHFNNTKKVISLEENNINYLNSVKLKQYCFKHLKYLYKENKVQHNRDSVDMSKRIKEADIDYYGVFAENISKKESILPSKTNIERAKHSIKSYFNYRNETEHWNTLMDKEYNYYSTFFLQDKGVLYSITIMTTSRIF